ncbi:MAG: CBS domain-containing protein [Candidatus Roizmanbacteria bacterium]|nr:CBS domain-containing protein [Candidatus Roizmanbacteria bacterium]
MATIKAADILKTENILRINSSATLKEALALLTRSHDAVFVFDDADKFLGIISPYYVIFKSKFPPETKLENCLYVPPKITPDTTIWDIAKLMVESKVYYLPVLENNVFKGIVTLNRILKALLTTQSLRESLEIRTPDRLITIKEQATVSDAYQVMKDKQVSRLPLVNDTGRLVGIITRFDIQQAFAKPKQKLRWLSRIGDKTSKKNQPITKYSKKMTAMLPYQTTGREIVEKMVRENVGSVILINANYEPVDIVSSHDILKAISRIRPKGELNVTIDAPDLFVHHSQLTMLLNQYMKKYNKRYAIRSLGCHVELLKNAAGDIRQYTFQLTAQNTNKNFLSKDTNFDWKKAARGALEKMEHQLRRA